MAITVKIQDDDPTTVLFSADIVAGIARIVDQKAGRPPYNDFVRDLAARFVSCKQVGADLMIVGAGLMWTALYHPQVGAAMREAISRELRDKRKAPISWRLSEKRLGLALGDRFINLDAALSQARLDSVVIVSHVPDDECRLN